MHCSQRLDTTFEPINPTIDLCIYKGGKMSRQMYNISYYYTSDQINELFKFLPHKMNY